MLEVVGVRERGEGEERGWVQRRERGAASSPAASDPVRISAPPAAGWSTAKSGQEGVREVGVAGW